MVDAARDAGVRRLIQESVVMIYADAGAAWISEDRPVDHFPIARGNHAAEANARRFTVTGGHATVLRFGVFYGRETAHSKQILALARHHIGFVPGRGDTYLSSIHLDDAANAVVAAMEAPAGTLDIRRRPATHEARVCNSVCRRRQKLRPGFMRQADSRYYSATEPPH